MTNMATVNFLATYLKRPTATAEGKLGVRILPTAASAAEVIRNINIALVIDQSGSMEGDRIASVKRTIRLLIAQLSNGDKISLVAFSSRATTLIRSETISDASRTQIEEAVNQLTADGGTNMESGIVELGSFVSQTGLPDAVVVLTDGHINEGISTIAGLSSVIGSYLQTTPIYTLGYGVDHNGDLLRALASRTHGTYTFIDTEVVLPASVGDLLGGLQGEVAKSAELAYPEAWKCDEPVDQSNPGIRRLGSLIADKPTWVMFSLPAGTTESELALTYKIGDVETRVVVQAADDGLDAAELEEQVLRCVTGHTLDAVAAALRNHDLSAARARLEEALTQLENSPAKSRPLCIRMKAQLAEMKEEVENYSRSGAMRRQNATVGLAGLAPAPAGSYAGFAVGGPPSSMAAMLLRTSSTASNYGAQRGVTSLGGATLGATASDGIFSSPTAVRRNRQMVTGYTQGGSINEEDDAHATVTAALAAAAGTPPPGVGTPRGGSPAPSGGARFGRAATNTAFGPSTGALTPVSSA